MTTDNYTVGPNLRLRLCCLQHDHQGWGTPCHHLWVQPPEITILLLRQVYLDIRTPFHLVIPTSLDTDLFLRHQEALLLLLPCL